MTENEEFQQRENSSRGGCLLVGSFLLAVMYVLSPPFVVLGLDLLPASAQTSMDPILQVMYAPLGWLYENFEIVEGFYDWYLALFDFL